ncbi:MAG: cation transporter [Chloroflexi bacterium]|nr:cation transporter [Chloroflexota bacterium]
MSAFQSGMAILMLVMSLSLGAAVWRLLRGPSIPDRVVAFDLIIIHLVGLITMFVVTTGELVLLDTLIVISVLGFLGTVAIARLIEEGRS